MARMYQSEDSKLLKESADRLQDKFLIIGMNILDQKKFKKQSNKQIYDLEELVKHFLKKDVINQKLEDLDLRVNNKMNAQFTEIRSELSLQQEELTKQVRDFNQKMDTTYKETLWKIKDVEKIMEARISE